MENLTGKTIAVAVSGGADSLYTLMALKEQGIKTLALHAIFLEEHTSQTGPAAAMRKRLSRACAHIGTPLTIKDLSGIFLNRVIRPFAEAYAQGLTPNPCALCNAEIKFGLLLEEARTLGADALATGHYAELLRPQNENTHALPHLIQGRDATKDQSYFLALTPWEAFSRTIFPLGDTTKADVLQRLTLSGVELPEPGESQDVCFVPGDDYRSFVPQLATRFGITLPGPGPMLLEDGTKLGTHKGLWQYTEGQRKGLGIGWKEPLHVLGKEQEGNVLRLGPKTSLRASGCECGPVNFLCRPDEISHQVWVKTRYREKPKRARIELFDGGMRLFFLDDESAVAAGQVAAVYVPCTLPKSGHESARPMRLLAGSVITKTL